MPKTVHLRGHLPPTDGPVTVELAFRHASNGTSQCTLTSYKKSSGSGVSLPTCQKQDISVPTYSLEKSNGS